MAEEEPQKDFPKDGRSQVDRLPPHLAAYREQLLKAYENQSQSFDKAVMVLAGGTLAISLTFVKEVVGSPKAGTVCYLTFAWIFLAVSIVSILTSMLTSQCALRRAISQIDRRQEVELRQLPGGWATWIALGLNMSSCIAFVLGVLLLGWFAIANMK